MSKLNKKFLISGCGLSFGGQERKTWVNIFRAAGVKLTDVGGPAVSNQWILNKAILALYDCQYDAVIIQLSGIGKLDVEINGERYNELVVNDPIKLFAEAPLCIKTPIPSATASTTKLKLPVTE